MKKNIVIIVILIAGLFLFSASTASAQIDYCEGNFDYDQDQDGSDAFTFKEDFGRSTFGNPCPPDGPAPLPKTGQTDCWDVNGSEIICHPCQIGGPCYPSGQDGMWQSGVALSEPRFRDNEDGTVTDNLTGIIWMENANCFGELSWLEALDECNNLSAGYCGVTDGSSLGNWRLANRRELFSLIHDNFYSPALSNSAGTGQWSEGNPFTNVTNVIRWYYWTSTTYTGNQGYAWLMRMEDGHMIFDMKVMNNFLAWCVRGGR